MADQHSPGEGKRPGEDVTVEHVEHDCHSPGILPLPDGASFVIARWRCPVCGRKWRIKSYATSSEAQTYGWRKPWWMRSKWLRPAAPSGGIVEVPE